MAIYLGDSNLIIPIKNIEKCESLGGFNKFIEGKKSMIGIDIWYDDHLYRERNDPDLLLGKKFWQSHGLEPYINENDNTWKDFCIIEYFHIERNWNNCPWLEIDPIANCAWLKGTEKGKIIGNQNEFPIITETRISNQICESIQTQLDALKNSIGDTPQPFYNIFQRKYGTRKKKFNANDFLKIFDRIKLDTGYKLDYIYLGDHIGGRPFAFTRIKFNILGKIVALYEASTFSSCSLDDKPHVRNISFEQSPIGYFQFCVFSVAITQFYLYWHARTAHVELIFTRKQIDSILTYFLRSELIHRNDDGKELNALLNSRKSIDDYSPFVDMPFSGDDLSKLYAVSLEPVVRVMEDGHGEVRMVSYSEYQGFYHHFFYIKFPCYIKSRKVEIARYPYEVNY